MKLNTHLKFTLYFSLLLIFIAGCSFNHGRYQQKNDSKPTRLPTEIELRDATPRAEAKSKGGNRNYNVRGKYYTVLDSAKNYEAIGEASWYGKKFHGHLTSNGEIYNMYGMSAAHKSLPLPTYVKVTNLDNNKSVIVRVNDRGPFHQDRIIDLSYSAAVKLDMLKTGVAKVSIKAITDFSPKPTLIAKPSVFVIQILATRNKKSAIETTKAITSLFNLPAKNIKQKDIYKVRVGPFSDKALLNKALSELKNNGYPSAFPVKK